MRLHIECLPVDGDDFICVHLRTSDADELEITCLFSKENPRRLTGVSTYKLDDSK